MGKAEGYFFTFIGIFLAVSDLVYWPVSHDWTGTVCLALSSGLGFLIAFFLITANRRMGDRPEDRHDARIEEGAGDLAHFSPYSVWPVALAFSSVMGLIGFIFGLWITFIAAAAVLVTGVGLLFEHFRGHHLATEEETGVDPIGMGGPG